VEDRKRLVNAIEKDAGVDILHACGGNARCTTCRVERSTNGGTRWEPATLPESATLIAGSSPSASICWLVGRAGSIYVTTDGLRFVRVPFGDRTDFVSIRAIDGRRATVVTIDGRTMRTEDQGVTWIRVSP
jgi:photosystem II stability/assembly factor-like uncharacterized protein